MLQNRWFLCGLTRFAPSCCFSGTAAHCLFPKLKTVLTLLSLHIVNNLLQNGGYCFSICHTGSTLENDLQLMIPRERTIVLIFAVNCAKCEESGDQAKLCKSPLHVGRPFPNAEVVNNPHVHSCKTRGSWRVESSWILPRGWPNLVMGPICSSWRWIKTASASFDHKAAACSTSLCSNAVKNSLGMSIWNNWLLARRWSKLKLWRGVKRGTARLLFKIPTSKISWPRSVNGLLCVSKVKMMGRQLTEQQMWSMREPEPLWQVNVGPPDCSPDKSCHGSPNNVCKNGVASTSALKSPTTTLGRLRAIMSEVTARSICCRYQPDHKCCKSAEHCCHVDAPKWLVNAHLSKIENSNDPEAKQWEWCLQILMGLTMMPTPQRDVPKMGAPHKQCKEVELVKTCCLLAERWVSWRHKMSYS